MAAIDIGKAQFAQLIRGDKPVVVNYWAPWCGYCRRIGPALDRIAEKYSDTVIAAKVNIDAYPLFAEEEEIEVLPTLVLYQNGKAVDSIVAPESQWMIDRFLQSALEIQD